MKCDNEENGCEWNGELRQLDDHMAGCGFSRICCPNECLDDESKEVFVMRKDLDSHLCECPNREFECPHCQERGKYHEMTGDHLDDCPQIGVPCPKRCKTEVIRSQLQEHLHQTCPNVTVRCKYAKLGCKERPLRKDREGHEGDSTLHLQLALGTIVAMKEDIDQLQVAPCVFKFSNVESHRSKRWSSPPFYSHDGGYKMQLTVYVNEDGGDEVGVYISLLRGRNNDNLIWPFRGEVTISLLNQMMDSNHHSYNLEFLQHFCHDTNSILGGADVSAGWGTPEFISCSRLQGFVHQYLKDDSLYFRVSVKVHDLNKPWLSCTKLPAV